MTLDINDFFTAELRIDSSAFRSYESVEYCYASTVHTSQVFVTIYKYPLKIKKLLLFEKFKQTRVLNDPRTRENVGVEEEPVWQAVVPACVDKRTR